MKKATDNISTSQELSSDAELSQIEVQADDGVQALSTRKGHLSHTLFLSTVVGVALTVIAFMGALVFALINGRSTYIPGLLKYVAHEGEIIASPAHNIYVTTALLCLANSPITWLLIKRFRARKHSSSAHLQLDAA